ncbi:MAG: circadian clock KaiB family protein [Bacteroidota bacterium]
MKSSGLGKGKSHLKKRARTLGKPQPSASRRSRKEYVLRLYVTGTTSRSMRAIANIKNICESYLKGRYQLEVIDIYENPSLGSGEQIIATPTLIKKLPLPLRRFIGDLSNTGRVLLGLDLQFGHYSGNESKKTR